MAVNQYDQALEDLAPEAGAPDQGNPYADTLDQMDTARQMALRTSQSQALDQSPDKTADAIKIGKQLGIPTDAVLRDYDTIKKRANVEGSPYEAILRETPALASWAAEPENAQVAHDDMEQLGFLEWLFTAPQRAFQQGIDQVRFGQLKTESIFRTLTQPEQDLLNSYKFGMEKGANLGAGDSWFRKAVTGGAQQLPNLFGAALYAAKYGAVGAVTTGAAGAAVGSVVPGAGTAAGATAAGAYGLEAGMFYGAAKFGFQLEAGNALEEYEQFRDENGQPLDPAVARAAAIATGAINAGLEGFGFEVLLKSIPGVRKLGSLGVRSAVKEALTIPTVRAALLQAVKSYGTTLTLETSTEVAQRAVTILAGELGKAASGQNIERRGLTTPTSSGQPSILEDLANEGIGAIQSFAFTVGAGPALDLVHQAAEAKRAQQGADFFRVMGEGVTNSKLATRLPEKMQEFLGRVTKDGPIENVFAPVDTWINYWQSQKLDPAAVAAEVTGNPNALEDAQRSGTDLVIPTARYASKLAGTAHNAVLADELRLAPDQMNAREGKAFEESLKAANETPAQIEQSQVKADVQQQLVKAGVPEQTAAQYADVFDAAIGSMATRTGVDPVDLYRQYGLKIERPALEQQQATTAESANAKPAPTEGEASLGTEAAPASEEPALSSAPAVQTTAGQPEEIPGLADLEASLGGATLETVDQEQGAQANASGESAASLEATSRLAGMKARGEGFGVYDRAGRFRPLIGPDAVDYQPGRGETFGILSPDGFRVLTDNGGKIPASNTLAPASDVGNNEGAHAAGEAGTQGGPGLRDSSGELAATDTSGNTEAASNGGSTERRRLSPPEADELFTRKPAEENAARFTPEIVRELERIADELDTFPFIEKQWHWLNDENASRGKRGNAAGGAAMVTAGAAGAEVYHDIIAYAPVGKVTSGKRKGQPAREASGTRGKVLSAVRQALELKDIRTGLAEGAVRVAERRAADDYSVISRPELPPSWGREASRAFTDTLSASIDDELQPADFLDDNERDILEPDNGEGDTSFNVDEFSQSLFDEPAGQSDLFTSPATEQEKVDTLETGEQQPRLPGAGNVREQNVATPTFEAPFSLTPPENKGSKGKQTTLFQSAPADPEALAKWFGESKVVDASGKPLEVYHGTPGGWFESFDVADGDEVYFTDSIDTASSYSGTARIQKPGSQKAGNVAAYLKIENPLVVDFGGNHYDGYIAGSTDQSDEENWTDLTLADAIADAREKGHDGLIAENIIAQGPEGGSYAGGDPATVYVVFKPTQIKSVENRGTFDPNDERVLFQSAFHGSPHIFEKFSLHAIGSGEGAQAYGWGLYFASRRETAEYYRDQLSDQAPASFNALSEEENQAIPYWIHEAIHRGGLDTVDSSILQTKDAIERTRLQMEPVQHTQAEIDKAREDGWGNLLEQANAGPSLEEKTRLAKLIIDQEKQLAILEKLKASGNLETTKPPVGRVYQVDIPDDEEYLDYDKPASKQSPRVQAALQALGVTWQEFKPKSPKQMLNWLEGPTGQSLAREDIGIRESLREAYRYAQEGNVPALTRWQEQHQGYFAKGRIDPIGESIYDELTRAELRDPANRQGPGNVLGMVPFNKAAELASRKLGEHGVAGIKYLDGGSRARGEGSSNYVVFDDRAVKITEFYQTEQPAPEFTTATVQQWAADLKDKVGQDLEALELYVTKQGDIKLDTLAVKRGAARAGLGTRVMQELTRYADVNGRRIILSLAQKGYQPIEGGEKTTSSSRLEKFYRRFGFVKNAGRYKDFTIREGMYREPTLAPGLSPEQTGAVRTKTPAFQQWFGDSKVVDENGEPLRVFHGTTANFDIFDQEKANPESDFGAGFYFSNNPDDVDANYAGLGPDLTQKIELLAEQLAGEQDKDYNDPDIVAQARAQFVQHEGATIGAYLRMERPAVFGGDNPTRLTFAEEWEPLSTFDEDEVQRLRDDGYDDVEIARELSIDAGYEPTLKGTLPDFLAALERAANRYQDGDASEAIARIQERGYDGDLTLDEALKIWKADEQTSYFTDDNGRLVQSEIFRQALEDSGFDGIIDNTVDVKFGSQRRIGQPMQGMNENTVHYIAFSPTSIKSAIGNRGTYEKDNPNILQQEKRGSIRFGRDRQFTISLLEKADLSTFLHESGHLFLEIAGDLADRLTNVDIDKLTDQQRKFLGDYAGILQFLGVENRGQVEEAHHEKFAKAFEAYLATGEAPTIGLQSAFARFRAWMLGVYKSIKNLGVQLTPEVTAIFDRLLASDAAIAEAQARRGVQAMFTTAADAGMSERDFALYRDTVAKASQTAREKLDARLMQEVRREQEASWKAKRADIQAEVEAGVYAEPVYQALAAIRNGTHPNGDPLVEGLETKPLRLSREMVVDRYGKDRAKRLPPFTFIKDGGLDPEVVAQMFGFSSGDEMLQALEQAPPMRQVIEQQTSARMMRENGSLLLDGTLHEAAQAAIANEDRDSVIRAELRALGQLRRTVKPFLDDAAQKLQAERKERTYERRWFEAEAKLREAIAAGKKQVEIDELTAEVRNLRQKARGGAAVINAAIPPADVIRDNAKTRIASMKVGDIRSDVFWSASRRAAQQAIDRAARQDFDGAIKAKQQELVNLALYREAERALEDVDKRVRYAKDLGKPSSRARLGLAGANYQDQVDGILDAYEFATVPKKALERRASLARFLAGLEAAGLPVPEDLPPELLEETRRTNYKNLTVEELVGVTDGLKMIVHLAQLKNRLLKAEDAREFAEVRTAIVDAIRTHSPTVDLPLEFTGAAENKRRLADWFASHTKISQLAQALDGYVDGGPVWTNIIKPLNDAANAEADRNIVAGTAYRDIIANFYTADERAGFGVQQFIPAIGASLSKEARLAVALNWGNETSRDRLTNDPRRRWNRQQVEAILATLDKRDFDFVQATFDFLETFWPEIAAKQERVTGIAPEKVPAAVISTPFGDYKGGYYPLMYDARLNIRSQQLEAASEAKGMMQAAYVSNTTKRGHVETRKQNVKLSVRLDLGVAFQHMQQVIHDLTHHEALIDVQRILRDPAVSNAILETKGDVVYQQFTRALQDIAAGNVNGRRPTVLDKAATFARQGTQLSLLGLNLWTAAQQPLGLFNGMSRVGVRYVARGMRRFLRDATHMENTVAWINSVSPMMKHRLDTATQDLSDLRQEMKRSGGWFDKLVRKVSFDKVTQSAILDGYLWHIGLMQRVADVPTWLGQYEKSKDAGETEERAIALADQAVLDSQGGGQIKDLAQVQRGGPIARLFMTFYSYGNTVFNATARAAGKTNFKSPVSVLEFLGHVGLLYAAPAMMSAALARGVGRDGGDDDSLADYFLDAGKEMLSSAMNTMVGIRELAGLIPSRTGQVRGYAGPAGARLIQLAYDFGQQAEQGELDTAFFKAANRAGGILFRYPAAQIERTVDGYVALEEGRTSNPLALLFGGPPKNAKK